MRTAVLVLALCGICLAANAAPIVIYNTGVDEFGVPLPYGTLGDPHYSLISVPSGTTQTRTNFIGGWLSSNGTSEWISPDYEVYMPVGTYIFRTTFELPSDGALQIEGRWATDNVGVDILVNGISTGMTNVLEFSDWTDFSFAATGIAGTNSLDFVVENGSSPPPFPSENPVGLRVEISSATFEAVPEPASFVLGALAFCGVCAATLRRGTLAQRK